MKFKLIICLLSYCILLFSCNTKKNKDLTLTNVAFTIDSVAYLYKDIDATVRQELFDELNRIYSIRKIASDFMIQEKLLEAEAKSNNISVDSLLRKLYKKKITNNSILKFIQNNNIQNEISLLERSYTSYNIKSDKGQKVLIERFKKVILREYIDSLKNVHKINFYLKPPISPTIKIKNLMTYY